MDKPVVYANKPEAPVQAAPQTYHIEGRETKATK